MAFSIFGDRKEEYFLVFDIGNGSVSGAFVKRSAIGGKTPPEILGSAHTEIPVMESVNFDRLLDTMLGSVSRVSEQLVSMIDGRAPPCYVVLASPWYSAQTKLVTLKKDRSFPFTKALRGEMLSREAEDFEHFLKQSKNDGDGQSLVLMENEIMRVRLNGYETNKPLRKEASKAELAIYMGVGQKRVIDGIKNKLYSHFPHSEVFFHSFPLAYWSAIHDMNEEMRDFLFIDVSGEVSDIALVKDGALFETYSFPFGQNFLLRRISSQLRQSINEARSLLSIYAQGSIITEEKNKLEKIISDAKKEWLIEFQKALEGLSGELYLPDGIFLAIDDNVADIFTLWIKNEEFSQYSFSREKFSVVPLSRILTRSVRRAKEAPRDEFLDIDVLFAQKIIGEGA